MRQSRTIETHKLPLAEAKDVIHSADLLLFEGDDGDVISDGIMFTGRTRFSHAAKASWWIDDWGNRELWCLEAREFAGCRGVSLESQVQRFPGRIHAFRANAIGLPELSHAEAQLQGLKKGRYYDRQGADALARKLTGKRYGYLQIFRTAAVHSPVLFMARCASNRLPCLWPTAKLLARLTPDVTNDQLDDGRLIYCSSFCAVVDRLGGGCDPVPDLSDAYTEPGDLGRSWFYRGSDESGYLGTLVE